MRLALLADIHGNWEALTAAISAARSMQADGFVVLGDVVGYGPDPAAVTERVMELARDGAVVIAGNHDAAISRPDKGMSDLARTAIDWTRSHLSEEHVAFLKDLPLQHRSGDVLYVHASPVEPARWHYVTDTTAADEGLAATDARLTFVGHTHKPVLFHARPGGKAQSFMPTGNKSIPFSGLRRYLTVVGSVGQPRDGNPLACFGLFDTTAQDITIARVPYDVEATMRKIRDAGLPDRLATRLLTGQ